MMIETENWKEVSKAKATKIFNDYGFVYALASKLNPENPWWGPSLINTECFNNIDGFISSYKYSTACMYSSSSMSYLDGTSYTFMNFFLRIPFGIK